MTISVYFHFSNYRTFKHYYLSFVCKYLRPCFPDLVSYNRFVELLQEVAIPLIIYLRQKRMGKVTGFAFIDSTPIPVCHNKRISSHRVFRHSAQRGKTSMGWFYGFKLHLIINDKGELLSFTLTAGNTSDVDQQVVLGLCQNLFGKLFGDKGYISKKLAALLREQDIQLITKLRNKMKNVLMPIWDKVMLRKRALIESVNDELKNICQIQHTRHRSPINAMVNPISGLIAYSYFPKKPSLKINPYHSDFSHLNALSVVC